jgi:UDP-N-acetylmuramoyl-tripeptide--D-alanyl-D-alanine ligase
MMQMSLAEVRLAVGGKCVAGILPARGMGVPPMRSTGVPPVSESERQRQRNSEDRAGTALEHTGKMPVPRLAGILPALQRTVCSISTDSRLVKPGDLFVAIKGEKFDAHAFLEQVFKAGAAGAIIQRQAKISPEVLRDFADRLIVVADTVAALGLLGGYHRGRGKAKVIAVTGSNGKTTTKRMIEHILAKHFRGTCSPKSFNNNIGVPLTLLGAGEADDYVICEVGTNAPGEIDRLSAICRPDVAVITSVGETHLEKLGGIELVAVEKASMLRHLRPGGCAIVWADSQPLAEALKKYDCRLIRFGAAECSDLRLTDFVGYGDRVEFRVGGVDVSLPQPGRHNASNATAAIAVAMRMGIPMEQAAADLADFGGVAMRLESMQIGPLRVINDAYNANPSSMLAAADVLAGQEGKRRVMIAGDMLELGPDTRKIHERVGADIAGKCGNVRQEAGKMPARSAAGTAATHEGETPSPRTGKMPVPHMGETPMPRRGIDLLIGIGALGRYIASGARSLGLASQAFESLEAVAEALPSLLEDGDVVLIKGSRGAALERLIPPLREAMEKK